MRQYFLGLPRLGKQAIVITLDICLGFMATWLAYSLRFDAPHQPTQYQWIVYFLAPLTALPVFITNGLYRAVFRYTGLAVMNAILKSVLLYGAVLSALLLLFTWPSVPRSLGVLQPLILLVLIASSRALMRFWLNHQTSANRRNKCQGRLLIYGAGSAGVQIALGLQQSGQFELIGFIDDNAQLHGKTIYGQTVFAPQSIESLIDRFGVTDILLAMPSIQRSRRNELLSQLRALHVHIRSLPDLVDLAKGKITVSDIRDLDIEDLLGRDPVPPRADLIGRNIADKTVLVTGAGGSIGSELCRQILVAKPSKLLLLDHSEFALYSIYENLRVLQPSVSANTEIIALLGNVRDHKHLSDLCKAWQPNTIYHAAAYKHVPLVEHNPAEGLRNNIYGTLNVAQVALENAVQDFVLISTDKAVRPTNIMGASKRLCEMVLQALANSSEVNFNGTMRPNHTRYSMVRFGNVLGSSGSVVPLFREQIKNGGPVTLTHSEVTRYFMTIPEAAQLVIQAGAMAKGGDVFVLDMGDPVRIFDLASRMIELSGLQVLNAQTGEGDIEIHVTGLRPGEKLYEELLIGDNPEPTAHPRIMKAHEHFLPWETLQTELVLLEEYLVKNDIHATLQLLSRLVSGYQPADGIADWIYQASQPSAQPTVKQRSV